MSTEGSPSRREQIGSLVSRELLALLEEIYPLHAAIPTMTDSDRMIGKKVGERSVIDFLKLCYEAACQPKVLS